MGRYDSLPLPGSLSPRERKMILPLIRDILQDFRLAGVLADLLNDAVPTFAERIRHRITYAAMIEALDFGCWKGRIRASRCRGIIRREGSRLSEVRQRDHAGVEMDVDQEGVFWVSEAEREGFFPRLAAVLPPQRFEELWAEAESTGNCRRLIWAALDARPTVAEVSGLVHKLLDEVEDVINSPVN